MKIRVENFIEFAPIIAHLVLLIEHTIKIHCVQFSPAQSRVL